MGNIIFSCSMLIMSIQFFFVSYRLTGINRVMMNIPISIFESSIPLVQDRDEPIMYFNKTTLNKELTSYFDKSLKKYVDDYTVVYFYYNSDTNHSCLTSYCDAIAVQVQTKVTPLMKYRKTVKFYIQKN